MYDVLVAGLFLLQHMLHLTRYVPVDTAVPLALTLLVAEMEPVEFFVTRLDR